MNVLRCQVRISKVVQIDIPEEKLGNQLPEVLAKLTARSQYGYDHDAEVLLVERSHVESAPNTACTGLGSSVHSRRTRHNY